MYRDLTKGSISRSLVLFALPMMAGNLLQQFYNIADTLIVGRALGANALAAVGSAYTLMTFLTSIFLGLSMGSGALFSAYLGSGDRDALRAGVLKAEDLPREAIRVLGETTGERINTMVSDIVHTSLPTTISPLLSHADAMFFASSPHSSKKMGKGYVESERIAWLALVKRNFAPQAMEQNLPIISRSRLTG